MKIVFHFILKLRGFHKLANLIISRKGEDLYIGNPKKNQTNDGYTLKGVSVLNTTLDEIIGSIASYRWIMMDGNDVDMIGIREEIEAIY